MIKLKVGSLDLRTIWLSLGLLIVLLAALEAAARSSFAYNHLELPSLNSTNNTFEIKLDALDRLVAEQGAIDCLFIGSSLVVHGVDPQVFTHAYQARSGQSISCFNFGIYQQSSLLAGKLGQFLVERYHPKILLYGTTARDYVEVEPSVITAMGIEDNPYFLEKTQGFNWEGRLIDQSMLYRYYLRYQGWGKPTFEENFQTAPEATRLARQYYGFVPFVDASYNMLDPTSMVNSAYSVFSDFVMYDAYVQDLDRLLALDGQTHIFIFEAPVNPRYVSYFPEGAFPHFLQTVGGRVRDHHIPFWETTALNLIPDAAWKNYHHMRVSGAYIFSYWLGTQLGEAVRQGLWTDAAPSELISTPPIVDLEPASISDFVETPVGLSDANYQRYLAYHASFDLIPQGALVFNPAAQIDDPALTQVNAGLFLEDLKAQTDDPIWNQVFSLMVLQDQIEYENQLALSDVQREALGVWRIDKQPQHLRAAGIEYVICTRYWKSVLDEQGAAAFNDPQNYELIASWEDITAFVDDYYLYKVHN